MLRAIITLIVTLAFVLSPLLTSPFSGFTADQLPIPQIDPPVQPAGYAFAIWGLIYLWLVVSALFGLVKRASSPAWDAARTPLIISLAIGTPWLAVANISPVAATVMIFAMAATAIAALLKTPATKDRLTLRGPVGLYAGWLTAAAFVSLGSTAAGYGLVTDAQGWAYIGITGALVCAAAVIWRSASPAYTVAVLWALVGIVVANGTANLYVTLLAGAGIVLLIGLRIVMRITAPMVPS